MDEPFDGIDPKLARRGLSFLGLLVAVLVGVIGYRVIDAAAARDAQRPFANHEIARQTSQPAPRTEVDEDARQIEPPADAAPAIAAADKSGITPADGVNPASYADQTPGDVSSLPTAAAAKDSTTPPALPRPNFVAPGSP